jgi:hypothetical protein
MAHRSYSGDEQDGIACHQEPEFMERRLHPKYSLDAIPSESNNYGEVAA